MSKLRYFIIFLIIAVGVIFFAQNSKLTKSLLCPTHKCELKQNKPNPDDKSEKDKSEKIVKHQDDRDNLNKDEISTKESEAPIEKENEGIENDVKAENSNAQNFDEATDVLKQNISREKIKQVVSHIANSLDLSKLAPNTY
ncbi:MAG: hypothetical protein LBF70_01900 [Holosporales bacterium]|jgi:hypothetical protein|nr:hypothetical protein [Holosporales bacterium]